LKNLVLPLVNNQQFQNNIGWLIDNVSVRSAFDAYMKTTIRVRSGRRPTAAGTGEGSRWRAGDRLSPARQRLVVSENPR
jgi:hypothetical protein